VTGVQTCALPICDPKNMYFGNRRRLLCYSAVGDCFCCHSWILLSQISRFARRPTYSRDQPIDTTRHLRDTQSFVAIQGDRLVGAPVESPIRGGRHKRVRHFFRLVGITTGRTGDSPMMERQIVGLRTLVGKNSATDGSSYTARSCMFHWMACWTNSRALRKDSFSLMWA